MHPFTPARTLIQSATARNSRSLVLCRQVIAARRSNSSVNQAQSPKSTPKKTPSQSVETKPEAPPDLLLKQIGKVETEPPLVYTVTMISKDIQDIKMTVQWGIASAVAAASIGITIGSVFLNRRDIMIQARFDVIGRQLSRLFDQVKTIEQSLGVVENSVGAVGESVGASEKMARSQIGAVEVKVEALQHDVRGLEKQLEGKVVHVI